MFHFKRLMLVASVFAVAGCATQYEKRYDQRHLATWKNVARCPTQVDCACKRVPANTEEIKVSHKEFKVERTNLIDKCGKDTDTLVNGEDLPNNGEYILRRELKYYPGRNGSIDPTTAYDQALPLLGVSLSGGGARSASTSIGFLGALDANGILDNVDIVSSVSGGSYASYWFFSHLYNARIQAQEANDELSDVRDKANAKGRYAKLFADYFPYDDCPLGSSEEQRNLKCRPRDLPVEVDREQPKPTGDPDDKELWKNARFQESVAMHSHLGTKAQQQPLRTLEMVPEVLFWMASIPLHWLEAGLFDRKQNRNPLTFFYHSGIERAYGLYPVAGSDSIPQKSFKNSKSLGTVIAESMTGRQIGDHPEAGFIPRYGTTDPSMRDLPEFMQSQKEKQRPLPFWVVNATAAYGGGPKMLRDLEWSGFSHDLRDTVYEFTPIHYGSPRLGYCSYPGQNDQLPGCNSVWEDWLKYSRIVGASGAAVDGLSAGINVSLDVLNAAIGRYIENPRVDDSVRRTHSLLPFPFYGLHRSRHDEAAPSIYLSDGGQSENLGLYALIKRRVKNIIVLDAEQESTSYDENYRPHKSAVFESLQRVRCRLYAEHGLHLRIARYDEYMDENEKPFFVIVNTDGSTREAEPCESSSAKDVLFSFQGEAFPYLKGRLCLNGLKICADENRLNILYVKLAVDSRQIPVKKNKGGTWTGPCKEGGRYACAVQFYFHDHAKTFPHDSTFDINYSKDQYAAYRDLGRDLGKCITFADGRLSLDSNAPGCQRF